MKKHKRRVTITRGLSRVGGLRGWRISWNHGDGPDHTRVKTSRWFSEDSEADARAFKRELEAA